MGKTLQHANCLYGSYSFFSTNLYIIFQGHVSHSPKLQLEMSTPLFTLDLIILALTFVIWIGPRHGMQKSWHIIGAKQSLHVLHPFKPNKLLLRAVLTHKFPCNLYIPDLSGHYGQVTAFLCLLLHQRNVTIGLEDLYYKVLQSLCSCVGGEDHWSRWKVSLGMKRH